MALFCIPKNLIQKLKDSALKGEIDVRKLYEMSSTERRAFFAKHTDANLGKFINAEFEKAMISKQKTALTDWAKSVFTPTTKLKPVYKNILDKIKALDEAGVLTSKSEKVFLEDLVSDKLGVSVSPKQVEAIKKRAEKIDAAQVKLGNDLGNPSKAQETLDFFKAKKEMDDYLKSLTPASKLKVLTGTIGRGMMLFSAKSPLLNIGSNIEIGFAEALSRRLATGALKVTNNKLAIDYVKMINKVYQKTGYDLSRMTSLNDSGASGARVLGETVHAGGPGVTRKVGRFFEDVVFKQLMGAPDTAFSSAHFADSVNINSLKLAKGDKVKADRLMNDAMRLEPQTPEGEILRQQAILDAEKATWTNTSWASRISLGIRKIINDVSGDLRVGDYLLPFIKTPANVIATGMDYAGMGIPKALVDTVKSFRVGDLKSKEYMQRTARNLVRSGLGITAAIIFASQFDDDDFVGAYDPTRAQIESLRNSNYNAIRVGGKWVSVDWLGPLAVGVSSIMYARKYGATGGERTFQYGRGVLSQVKRTPGVSDIYDYVRTQSYKKNQTLPEMLTDTKIYFINQFSSRLIPSFFSDIAKAIDPKVRTATKGLQALQAKVPILREKLPAKRDVFGEEILSESALSTILFGSRVKTDKETDAIKEVMRVSDVTGKAIKFTDWDKSSTKALAQFKLRIGRDRFDVAKIRYGRLLGSSLEKIIKNPKYKSLSDSDKLKKLNRLDSDATSVVFKIYRFKYKSATKR